MKQPILGIVATALVIAVALGFITLFDFPTFSGWVTYLLACIIPMEILIGVTWATNQPSFAGSKAQPLKGILLVFTTLVVGAIVAAVLHKAVGAAVAPPAPMLMVYIIASVVVMFWLSIMFGGWPFTSMIKNPVVSGLVMLAACYVINYLLFRIFFDFGFMKGAPVYVDSLDPHGMFNANSALTFFVTVVAFLFFFLHFDLWPFTTSPSVMKQPVLGIVWTLTALVLGGLAYYLGVNVAGMDPMAFQIKVPVPFVFGTIVVLNMLHNSVFAKLQQPAKGFANVILAAVIGSVLAMAYGALVTKITGDLKAGPPTYDYERWLASALLAVTFPLLIFFAEFFKMWPLHRPSK